MTNRLNSYIYLIFLLFAHVVSANQIPQETGRWDPIVYLTWQGPSTHDNISINVIDRSSEPKTVIFIKDRKRKNHLMNTPQELPGKIGFLSHIKIDQLRANTTYKFQIGDAHYKFRTLPKKGGTLRFISGGDMNISEAIYRLPSKAIENDLDFILLGGDLAYGDGRIDNAFKWIQWFRYLEKVYKSSDGRIVPLISVIGNHEVNNLRGDYKIKAPFYSRFFVNKMNLTYFYKVLSDHSILIGLDSGHIVSHESQIKFIEEILSRFASKPNLLAFYHVPLRSNIKRKSSKEGQIHWQPLFDQYKLDVAFEHHAHTLKRSFLNNSGKKVKEGGVLYLGDGAWRDNARSLLSDPLIQVSSNQPHIWYAELSKGSLVARAMAQDKIFDSFKMNLIERKITSESTSLSK